MDPNTGKKGMFNKLSNQQAMRLLKKETIKRKTVSFYKYVILDHPEKLRDELYAAWKDLGFWEEFIWPKKVLMHS